MQLKISFVLLFSLLTISLAANVTVFDDLKGPPLDTESNTTTTLKLVEKNVTGNNLTDYVPTSPHDIIETTTIKVTTNDTEAPKLLEMPENITVKAINESVDNWGVHVGWGQPRLQPDSYTVTLVGKTMKQTIVVPGNASEVVFNNVKAKGIFYVFVDARLGSTTASSNIEHYFPAVGPNMDKFLLDLETVEAIRDSVDTWEVHVGWKTSGVVDGCYTVEMQIEEYGTNYTMVVPGNASNRGHREVVFKDVKGDGPYFVSVEARLFDRTTVSGRREWFPGSQLNWLRVQNITVEAVKDSFDTWEVHVGWGRPREPPQSFIVELHIEKYGRYTTVIPWNESEAVFKDVKGEGTYDVVIKSKSVNNIATSSTRAWFPGNATNTTTIVLSTLGVVLVLAVIYIATCTKCNRAGTTQALPATAHRFEPFYPNMLFRRECDREIAEIEQHVYEEVGPPVYDVIAPSICSYEEIDPVYEEINPSDTENV